MNILYLLAHAGEAPHWSLPPLHPILVNFTAALIPISLLCDVLARLTHEESLRSTGWWTLCFAALISPFTALAGWLWLRTMPEMDQSPMTIHKWMGTAIALAIVPLAIWRGRSHLGATQPGAVYLLVMTIALGALVYQADVGGMMSFGTGQASMDNHGHMAPTPSPSTAPMHEHNHDHAHSHE